MHNKTSFYLLLVAIVVVLVVLGCSCKNSTNEQVEEEFYGGKKMGSSSSNQKNSGAYDGYNYGTHAMAGHDQSLMNQHQPNTNMVPQFYESYQRGPYMFSADAYNRNFPNEQDPSSLYTGVSACTAAIPVDNDPYAMNVQSLLPASWKTDECGGGAQHSQWTKYGPRKDDYMRAQIVGRTALLPLSTRVKNPTGGIPNLLRSSTSLPLSGSHVLFNGSSHLEEQNKNLTGSYSWEGH